MQNLIVTLVQTHQFWEDKSANFRHLESFLSQHTPSDVLVLPEMFHTGFSMNAEYLAETMDESEAMEWLIHQAKTLNTAIYTSFIAKENDRFFNRGVFVETDGSFHTYDKRKTFTLAGETTVFERGTEEVIVKYKGWKINLQICFDLRFPELIRNRLDETGNAAYDLLIYVANWPEKRSAHWSALLRARAIENQCYVIGLNRVGSDANGLSYSGDSVCIDALGNTVLEFPKGAEEKRTADLNYGELMQIRQQLPFLNDRDNHLFFF